VRVLVANKFWYRRGGLERVMFDEIAWLEAAGHEVAHFSTTHPENFVRAAHLRGLVAVYEAVAS